MADRQYGLPSDYQRGNRTQVPAQSRQLPEYPAPSQASPTRSPPRKPVTPYSDDFAPPPPPPHRNAAPSPSRYRHQQSSSRDQNNTGYAAGGFAAAAPAYSQPQQSGGQPFREINNFGNEYTSRGMSPSPDFDSDVYEHNYAPSNPRRQQQGYSQSSIAPLSSHAAGMANNSNNNSPPRGVPAPGMLAYGYGYDSSMPSSRSRRSDGYDGYVDPRDIADDADDGFEDQPTSRRGHFAAGAGTGAGLASVPGMLKAFGGSRDTSGNYGQVPGGRGSRNGGSDVEKSEWLQKNGHNRSKKMKYIFGGLGVLIVLGIIAGVVGGIVATNPGGGSSSSSSSAANVPNDGKYNINSPEVKALLNNKNLHKVFPAMDYTPLNGQYPACLTVPVNQDNVTLDVAVLSQLTPAIRLYGTDCGQTEAVLKAIKNLEMDDKVKVWLGVWLDSNSTSNTRQLNQMYDILDEYDQSQFAGIIIGNEVLFREDMTETELAQVLQTARQKLTSKGIDLPVSTSDLGDNWTAELAADSDIVMANVHPFFAGVKPTEAPGWTWSFWSTHDANLAKSTGGKYPKSIISETGWPSQGGNDCGTGYKCPTKTAGAIAGIDEMNTFMDGWVCQSIANGTTYFWFEAIDEPWKEIFNTPKTGDYWEPHWGLLDVNRNLKDGLKIPDCGGKTLDSPY